MVNSHNNQRRNFLKLITFSTLGSSITLAAGSLPACSRRFFFNPENNIVVSGGLHHADKKSKNALIIINLAQKEKKIIDTPFLPHASIIDPNNKSRVLSFEKNGHHAGEIDLRTETLTQSFASENGQIFSGHAAFSHDGKKLYSIEINQANQQGIINIRDAHSFKSIKQLPTLGLLPHDCQLTKNNILMVSNTGTSATNFYSPSLVYINLDTEKLINRLKLDKAGLNCAHFVQDKNQNLVVASAPVAGNHSQQPGGVSIKTPHTTILTMNKPAQVIKQMTGEALGIAINQPHQIVAITHPEANLLTFWSLKNRSIVKAIGIDNPRGISQTINKDKFIISFGTNASIATITTDTLTPQADSILQNTYTSAEHMINWSTTLREIMPASVYD